MDIKKLVSEMTLKEKASLCSGWDFWRTKPVARLGIPKIMVSDGPHGLRKQADETDRLGINKSIVATCFPTGVGVAASFDRGAARTLGSALGQEAAAENLATVLGPAINIKRSPLCGRNFEYLSEDPYLAGELAADYINGVQATGVGVSVKHYAANNQERRRMSVSAETDERTLREIYLPAFETAVKKSQPHTIMCSYNKINGVHASDNAWLLDEVLRQEWGYEGIVMTDWGAVSDRVLGLKSGLDLEMPSCGGKNDKLIVAAVESGELDVKVLDTVVERLLTWIAKSENVDRSGVYDRDKDHALARKLAGECMVLLKNEGGILPLSKDKKIAFIGGFAKHPRYQGGGSSHINSYKPVGAFEAAEGIDKIYAEGYDDNSRTTDAKIEEAVRAARAADVALVFAGLPESYESEGFDRAHIDMPPAHNRLIEAVAEANPNTVVILHNGSPVAMPWLDKVKGVLEAYLGGEAVGEAEIDVLFGAVNPSAKLAESFPKALSDVASSAYFPGGSLSVEYREGLYVGYRYFDKAGVESLFPFGFGLSYTTFEYSDIKLDKAVLKKGESLEVSFSVKNTGAVAGAEAAQIYVADKEASVYRPVKELKGFEKVYLAPGEKKTVSVVLDPRAFAFYDTETHSWVIESGDFDILVGASSADIRLWATVTAEGSAPRGNDAERLPSYFSGKVENVSDEEFSALLGRPLSPLNKPEGAKLDLTSCFADGQKAWFGRLVKFAASKFVKVDGLGSKEMIVNSTLETPFRAMANMSTGILSDDMALGLAMLCNKGEKWKGFGKLFKGLFGIPKRIKKAAKNEL